MARSPATNTDVKSSIVDSLHTLIRRSGHQLAGKLRFYRDTAGRSRHQYLFIFFGYAWNGVRGSMLIQSVSLSSRERERRRSNVIQRDASGLDGKLPQAVGPLQFLDEFHLLRYAFIRRVRPHAPRKIQHLPTSYRL